MHALLRWLRAWLHPAARPPTGRGFTAAERAGTPAPDPSALAARHEAARREAEAIVARAAAEATAARERGLREAESHREALDEFAQRLEDRKQRLANRQNGLQEREQELRQATEQLTTARAELDGLVEQRVRALQERAGIAMPDAVAEVMSRIDAELLEEAERRLRAHEGAVSADAERRARAVIATAVQRLNPPAVPDPAADPLHSASPDARQKLLARNGHTLRAIEQATGCELSVEDVPGAAPSISLAGFDPVRREVARTALTWLIRDGAVNPSRVEAIIQKAQRDVAASIERAGAIAAAEAACKDLPAEVVRTLGRLRYRTSYGQNQLQHAIETSRLGAMLAHELGADVHILRNAALLHDLGKAIDRDTEGTHAMLGGEICRRNGMPETIVHCIEAHHEEIEPETLEARLTIIADSISGGRPGARRESLERYLARLTALEDVAHSFAGVERAFAIQAGRELRILVRSDQVDDSGAANLAKQVSQTIQDKLEYPGQIRVTVVRETRAVEYAR